jgi:two-component system invasion response regulator UvrY
MRVLLLLNNRIIQKGFKENLEKYFPFMIVEEAGSGEEARQRIKASPPEVILMDFYLPDMKGLQLTREIKKDFPNVHIAIFSEFDLPEYRRAVLQSGADRLFPKGSFNWKDVKAFVFSVLI